MNANEEKMLFRLADSIEPEAAADRFGDVEPSREEARLDAQTLSRIRSRTFAKLGLAANPALSPGNDTAAVPDTPAAAEALLSAEAVQRRSPLRRRLLAAAVAGLCLIAGALALYSSPDVRAQVRKMLQFIPGYGTVQSSEDHEILYILPAPVTHLDGTDRIDIRGVSIGSTHSSAALTGTAAPVKTMELINADGNRYEFKASMIASAGDWTGGFYYTGPIKVTEEMSVSFDGTPSDMKIRLTPPEKVDRVEDLGVTDVRSGITLTAVATAQQNGQMRVTLVPQLPPASRIESFGLGSYENIAAPTLTGPSGEPIPYIRDENFPNPNELMFAHNERELSGYKLHIPELALVRRAEQPVKMTIPLPQSGVLELNRQWNLLGFPVKVKRVERLAYDSYVPGSIRIEFDLQHDDTEMESLLHFFPDFSVKGQSGGASSRLNEVTRAMEDMTLEAEPDQQELTIYVTEIRTVVRGPWEFELKTPGN
ncbi:hypothetical protein [Paenibacillus sp. GCM10012303]|jgi:hypothetical protein|uniref:hypothetical protein n=1 Tax=Paenibacillus sp. GCM10012303 TaxID=3317340 RepID=UPI003618ACFF